jgi:uracil-DNA glycosylase
MCASPSPYETLNDDIAACRLCPRLVEWRELVAREKKSSTREEEYWGRPVPNFGDPEAEGLILGLAPAAHGANRTGRMFTGDRSGEWLYRSLHRVGLANMGHTGRSDDGLRLNGVLITAAAHCAPPDNKPTKEELLLCRSFLLRTAELRPWKAVLCLGSIAWDAALSIWPPHEKGPKPKFGHLVRAATRGPLLIGSYHPSQQNTFTGRLTEEMLDSAARLFAESISPSC